MRGHGPFGEVEHRAVYLLGARVRPRENTFRLFDLAVRLLKRFGGVGYRLQPFALGQSPHSIVEMRQVFRLSRLAPSFLRRRRT